MAISLRKGEKVDLTKKNPGLKKVVVGLGWDVNQFDTGGAFDLDAAAFLLDANGKVAKQEFRILWKFKTFIRCCRTLGRQSHRWRRWR